MDEEKSNSKSNNKVTTKEQQRNTNKNVKNDKNERNIYIVIFDHWNSKNIIVHKKLTDKMKRKISSTLETYSEDEIKRAIDNYSTILNGEEYYWTYKWTLEEFLQRGLERFLTNACFQNFRKDKQPHCVTKTNQQKSMDTIAEWLAEKEGLYDQG